MAACKLEKLSYLACSLVQDVVHQQLMVRSIRKQYRHMQYDWEA